jgi:molybdopterin-binding protein
MAEVVVELDGGQTVTAVITSGSADRLGLEPGSEVNAVVKATEVMVEAVYRFSCDRSSRCRTHAVS